MSSEMPFSYTIKQSKRARNLRITVRRGGEVLVTTPRFLPLRFAEDLILKKSSWIQDKLSYFAKLPQAPERMQNSKRDFEKHKAQAKALALSRLEYFNQFYGFKYNKVFIKNSKSRWGSCSRKGNLNFSYKIAMLPPELADYIIVHELCHLGQFKHSKAFWELVAKKSPNWKSHRKALKKL